MKRFNFEDGILELDSLLLCNINPVGGGTPQVPTVPVEGDDNVDPTKAKQPKGGEVPKAEPKEPADPGKTQLSEPKKPITPKTTKDTIDAMAAAQEKTIVTITELLQAIIKMNRDRKDMEVKMMWAECQNVVNNMHTQAENMRKDALKSLIIGICCSALSGIGGAISIGGGIKGLKGINNAVSAFNASTAADAVKVAQLDASIKATEQAGKIWSGAAQIAQGVGQLGTAIDNYTTKKMEAGNKDIDAQTEVLRTAMEEIKKCMDDARNAITSCQSNISELLQTNRQTLNKVMG